VYDLSNSLIFKPERLMGQKYDSASDIWSLGVTIAECAIGEFPYKTEDGQKPSGFWQLLNVIKRSPFAPVNRPGLSKELSDFIARCLMIDPKKRANVVELIVSIY
jgi:serine/threonine protein kinase